MDAGSKPIALIDQLDSGDRVLQSTPVYAWPVTVGRALGCDLVLDDPHIAPSHAMLDDIDGVLHLRVSQTINGAMVGAQHVSSGQSHALGIAQPWRVGTTRLRVRRGSDPIAPELPLARHLTLAHAVHASPVWQKMLLWVMLALLCIQAELWLDSEPGSPLNTYFTATLAVVAGIGVWSSLWALGSKLFQGRLDFTHHLLLDLRYGVIWVVLGVALPVLAFVVGWPILSHAADAVGAVVLCALLWAHLSLILPGHRRGLALSVTSLYLCGLGLNVWLNMEHTGRVFSELYASSLLPPAWRLAPMQAASTSIQDMSVLKANLDRLVREDESEDAVDLSEE
ncbi:MAG: FHA domain-containing protein [Aquabacterium sp.]|nr:FHA domain-containing protein [Aquabacterium sp.]